MNAIEDLVVKNIVALDDRAGFRSIAEWTALASGDHWGHPHLSRIRFRALMELGEVEGAWKLAGMTVLDMREETIAKLEKIGHKRAIARKADFPNFSGDITTMDFSGWPIFVHAQAPDELVTQICAAFEARKHLIPWQYEGPLPLERMCRDCDDAPLTAPLHPAAERFWKTCGYLD